MKGNDRYRGEVPPNGTKGSDRRSAGLSGLASREGGSGKRGLPFTVADTRSTRSDKRASGSEPGIRRPNWPFVRHHYGRYTDES